MRRSRRRPLTTLDGTTAVITGAGSGVGRLLALGLAARGAKIAVWDLDGEAAERTAAEIRGTDGVAEAFTVTSRTAPTSPQSPSRPSALWGRWGS